ncbi:MAG: hypothetical protein JW814_09545 [Candidatus Krumholzibacteriota bacterium]|nr:hypothetical protein [Candidatus Krumholzibacteriota bacterium]
MIRVAFIVMVLLCLFSGTMPADVPMKINYQGVLTDAEGAAATDGDYSMTFSIYDVAESGTALWTETQTVPVNKAIFSVMLGNFTPVALPFDRQYWLGIAVNGESELFPRVTLGASPYSLNTLGARGANIIPATGNVGIGTLTPAEMLDVSGGIRVGNTSGTAAGAIRWTGSDFEGYNGSSWQSFTEIGSGTVPSGTSGQTLRHTGSAWEATNSLFNNGTQIGIGTTAPTSALDVLGGAIRARRNDTQYTEIRNNNADGGYLTAYSPESNKKPLYIASFHDGSGAASGETWMRFSVGNSTAPTHVMALRETGRVGIGTISPARQFEVFSSQAYARLTSSTSAGSALEFSNTSTGADFGNYGQIKFMDASDVVKGSIASEFRSYAGASGLYLASGGLTRMVVTEAGDVGIGTIDPDTDLEIVGAHFRARRTDSDYQYVEIRDNDGIGAYIRGYSPQDNKKPLFIEALHNGLGTPSGETWMRFSVGSVNVPKHVMVIRESGNVGIGTQDPSRKLTVRGNLLIESAATGDPVVEFGEGLDYAEGFDVADDSRIEPGTVLVIDTGTPGKLAVSRRPYDTKVAGIAAGAKGLGSGVRLGVEQYDCDVALAGRVFCNVDATGCAIEPGDLLTTSAIPGFAMKASDQDASRGAILGKAMERLEQGKKGQILVLVSLQ